MFNLIKGTTGTCKTARMKMTILLKETFFTQVEQVVRKPNPRADRIFLKKEAFFHLRKHKNFSPVELMKKMEIANAPMHIHKRAAKTTEKPMTRNSKKDTITQSYTYTQNCRRNRHDDRTAMTSGSEKDKYIDCP